MSFVRNFSKNYRKQLPDIVLDALKTPSKKVVPKAGEATGEFIGNKIADTVTKLKENKIVKLKPIIDENSRNVEEIITLP